MYASLQISAAFSLFLLTSGLNCEASSSPNFEALPECTDAMRQTETATQLANCPALNQTHNLANPTDCCQYWKKFNCEKDILYPLPGCQSSRFYIEMQANLLKPEHTCVGPPASCVNVPHNRAITTVTENLFRPTVPLQEDANYRNCLADINDGLAKCMLTFDDLLKPGPTPADAAICRDELAFKDCAQKLAHSEPSCQQIKTQLDSLYTNVTKKVAKKCPSNTAGVTGVSLTITIFSLIVAFFARNV